jgi:hypothetical protein
MKRKVIQLIVDPSSDPKIDLLAVCDDGTMWNRLVEHQSNGIQWIEAVTPPAFESHFD